MNAVLRWFKKHGVVHFGIVAVFVITAVWVLTIVPHHESPLTSEIRLWYDSLEYRTVDYRMQWGTVAPADPQIVVLLIDQPSITLDVMDDASVQASPALSEMKAAGFPFPRDVYAQACDRLFSSGAKVVAFDILFRATTPNDASFQQTLDKYRSQIVVGLNFSADSSSYEIPPASLLPSQDPLDDRLGYFNFWLDTDNVLRSTQYRNNNDYMMGHLGAENLPKLYSLAARVVQKAGHPEIVPDDLQGRALRFAGSRRISTFSFYKIFDPHSWDNDFKHGDYFRDKIVVIGPEGDWSKDVFNTPWGILSGVEIHANAINALLHDNFLYPPYNAQGIGIVILLGLIALGLAALISSIALRFGAAVVVLAGYFAVVMWAYNSSGWLMPVVAPLFVFCGAGSVGLVYDFTVAQFERFRLRTTFERYNSKNVVAYLLDHADSYNAMLEGVRRDVTVLFSDIRGFTTFVETAPDPRDLVRQLNEYLEAMVACVFKYDGSLEKFMGDGIMAIWGHTPYNLGPKEDAACAVRTGLAMITELRRLNAKWKSEGRNEWKIGIGINHGPVTAGDMGSQQHKEFAVVGDPVNLGSRIEGLTKEYRLQLLIGEQVAELVGDYFHLRSIGLVQVKGKTKAVQVFTVLGEKAEPLPPEKEKFLGLHEEAMASFRRREFTRARELFEEALKTEPGDYVADLYLESSRTYEKTPPDADWNGVRVMTEK